MTMKFRTDFVTNSSSSSYIANFVVRAKNNEEIPLNLCTIEDEENAEYPWQHSRDYILKAVLNCKSVSELTNLLAEECERGLYDGRGDWLADIKEDDPDEYEELINEIQKRIKEFRGKMSEFSSLNEIETVIFKEKFYGWGEFANDNLDRFLTSLGGGTDECYDKEVLEKKVSEETADLLLQCVEKGCGDTFGYIDTIIELSDGSVHTNADMDVCTSW